MLVCPSSEEEPGEGEDFDDMPRSYVINGFNDILLEREEAWNGPNAGVRMAEILNPGSVIHFGEKRSDLGDFYMDLFEGVGNEFEVVQHTRHGDPDRNRGGSYYAFGDGSSRFLVFPEAFTPINQWATVKRFREGATE